VTWDGTEGGSFGEQKKDEARGVGVLFGVRFFL